MSGSACEYPGLRGLGRPRSGALQRGGRRHACPKSRHVGRVIGRMELRVPAPVQPSMAGVDAADFFDRHDALRQMTRGSDEALRGGYRTLRRPEDARERRPSDRRALAVPSAQATGAGQLVPTVRRRDAWAE